MRRFRRGFTMIEIAIVCVLIGMVAMIAYPRFSTLQTSAALRSGRQQTAAILARARASAVQRGWATSVVRSGDALRIVADSSGTAVTIASAYDLAVSDGVHLSPAPTRDTITFDPRGYASGLVSRQVFRFSVGTSRDSICVNRLGHVLMGCTS